MAVLRRVTDTSHYRIKGLRKRLISAKVGGQLKQQLVTYIRAGLRWPWDERMSKNYNGDVDWTVCTAN